MKSVEQISADQQATNRETPKEAHQPRILDIGCGPNKMPQAYGVDHYGYQGVDQVFDLDSTSWPLQSDSFDVIYARHVIEHIADIPRFMNEIHRVARDGAIVEIVTPHFTFIDSWKDPTHRWHLSCKWYECFTQPNSYLHYQVAPYRHESTELGFPHGLRGLIPRLMIKLRGRDRWEKRYAFIFRAKNITTRLRVTKETPPTST